MRPGDVYAMRQNMTGTLLMAVWLGACTWGWTAPAQAQQGAAGAVAKVVLSGEVMEVDPAPYREQYAEWNAAEVLWESGKFEAAVKGFQKVYADLKSNPGVAAGLAQRVGTLLKEKGKCQDALVWFERADGADSPVRNWARFQWGQCLRTLKRGAEAAEVLGRVEPWFSNRALALRCRCMALLEASKSDEFLACAEGHRTVEGPDPKLLLEEAKALATAGQAAAAARVYRLLASSFPTSSEAVGVLDAVKALEPKAGADAKLNDSEWVGRAQRFYERHKFQSAGSAADVLIEGAKPGTQPWCEALGVKGSALAKSGQQTNSLPHFKQMLEGCQPHYRDVYFYRAAEAARAAGKTELLEQFVQVLLKQFPNSTLCDDALLFLAVGQERAGKAKEAKAALLLVLERYPQGDMASEAAFKLVYSLFQAKKYAEASQLAVAMIPKLPAREDYRTDGRLAYWAARALQLQGKKKDSRELYRGILQQYPLSWYALLAYARLDSMKKGAGEKAMKEAVAASKPLLPGQKEVLAKAPADLPNLTTGIILLRSGLTDEARNEFDAAFGQVSSPTAELHLLEAALYHAGGHIDISHQILRREVPDFSYAWPLPDDDRWWLTAYPLGFAALLKEAAKSHQVPWCLVMAVMREESGFNPEIVSYANAYGLLQILPKTASGVAKKKVNPESLKIPSVNIPLGVEYFAGLMKRFNHPALAAAGYNSGPGGVKKTMDLYAGSELDEFVESIPYDQTRRYTKRVVSSAWRYHVLYGDEGWKGISLKIQR